MSSVEVFVWYRSATAERAAVQAAAQRLLAQVARRCAVHGRLLQRQQAECTWMEHYVVDDGAALEDLRQCLRDHWPSQLPERHEECFALVAAPAASASASPAGAVPS